MALLIMAIGVTSIFTLFPLSILRSIKANQLTNAKLVEENARELILANPQLITGAPPWTPSTTYGTQPAYTTLGINTPSDCWVTPRPRSGRLLPETNLLYVMGGAGNSGVSASFEPVWPNRTVSWTGVQDSTLRGGYNNQTSGYITSPPFPAAIYDGSLNDSTAPNFNAWFAYRHSRYEADPTWSAYVVDPLGWYEMNAQGLAAARDHFGQLDRIHCQLTPTQASQLFSSQDTWTPVLDATVPNTVAANVVTFDPILNLDLTQSRQQGRLVFLSEDGRRSAAVPIDTTASGLTKDQVAWTGTLPTDLDAIAPGEIFEVRIETYERRYSWMMTVRQGPQGQAKIDVVIFFNRSSNSLDEEAIGHLPSSNVNSATEGVEFQGNQALLSWHASGPAARAGGDPKLKEGHSIFDAVNGHWYRIQKVESYNKTTDPRTAVLTLNTTVTVPTSTAVDYDGQAILLPNIVTTFPIDIE